MRFFVVDPNVAFATLLAEELGRLGHDVVQCADGGEALAAAEAAPPDLALLDMALEDPDAVTLAHGLRALDHGVRLMLIPLMGEDLRIDTGPLRVQGVLPKPFFLPELPERIASALDAPLNGDATAQKAAVAPVGDEGRAPIPEDGPIAVAPAPAVAASASPDDPQSVRSAPLSGDVLGIEAALPETDASAGERRWGAVELQPRLSRRAFRINQSRIETLMRDLAAEVEADGVLLTVDTDVLAAVGLLGPSEAASIARAVLHGWETSAEVARILGREQVRFEQSITGGDYLLYALSVHDAILAVAVRGSATLGLLRHRARAAAERIADLCAG